MTTSAIINASPLPNPSGSNHSDMENPEPIDTASIIMLFIVPFGLIGNVISLVTIFHSRLRKTAANQYLIVLTIADSVFLLMLLMVAFKVDYLSYELCMITEYILMTSSYVSSWSIAALTIERYIAIAHPLKQLRYTHVNRSKIMLYWVPVPFILNLVQFFNLKPVDQPNNRKCVVESGTIHAIIEPADVFLCYIMPCLIVVILNLIVASKVENSEKNFLKDPEKDGLTADFTRNSRRQGRSASSSSGSTRILLVVPVVYILLNTPFYLFRIADIVLRVFFGIDVISAPNGINPIIGEILNIAHYLYFANFACDVIVYAFSSAHFRKTAVIAWQAILCPHWHNVKEEILNSQSQRRSTITTRSITVHAKEKPLKTCLKQINDSTVQVQSRQSLANSD